MITKQRHISKLFIIFSMNLWTMKSSTNEILWSLLSPVFYPFLFKTWDAFQETITVTSCERSIETGINSVSWKTFGRSYRRIFSTWTNVHKQVSTTGRSQSRRRRCVYCRMMEDIIFPIRWYHASHHRCVCFRTTLHAIMMQRTSPVTVVSLYPCHNYQTPKPWFLLLFSKMYSE